MCASSRGVTRAGPALSPVNRSTTTAREAEMRGSGRTFVRSVTALTGILVLAAGIWGIASPSSFADSVNFPASVHFVRQKTVLLTSYRRDGTPVGAPVSLAVEGDHAYFRSPGKGWKVRRIRNNPMVEVAPCTTRGKVTGPAIRGRATRIEGAGAAHAASVLRRKHPLLHGVVVPASHRLFRGTFGQTAHFELVPLEDQGRVARVS